MKRIVLIIALALGMLWQAQAQRFCIVDMEYVLKNVPEYSAAQKQIDQLSEQWKAEIDQQYQNIEKAYNKFQAEQVLMTDQMKQQKIAEIENLEKAAMEAQKAKFGPEGQLFKKRQELIKPIQDKIYEKIQLYAKEKSFDFILDKASLGTGVLFYDEKYDKSDDILKNLGY